MLMKVLQKLIPRIAFCVAILMVNMHTTLAAQTAGASDQNNAAVTTSESLIHVLMRAKLIRYEHFYALNGTGETKSGAPAEGASLKRFAKLLKKCDPTFVGQLPKSDSEAVLHASKLVVNCEDGGVSFTVTIYNSSAMYVSDEMSKTYWHLTGGRSLPLELVETLK